MSAQPLWRTAGPALPWLLIIPVLLVRTLIPAGSPGCLAEELCIEDFSRMSVGCFPPGWKIVGPFRSAYYRVRGGREVYLEARSGNKARAIGKRVAYDLHQFPFLSWRWRVLELPPGADERYKARGDNAAALMVALSGSPWPRTIRYVWSSSLARGTTVKSPHKPNNYLIVVRNQEDPLDTWLTEKVDVLKDAERLFPQDPGLVRAVAIQTDSDNTGSRAVAHYQSLTALSADRAAP